MNILIIGDIFGSVGRKMVEKYLPLLQSDFKIDFTIVNAENVTHGKSMSVRDYAFLKSFHVDAFTGGNHSFENNDFAELAKKPDIIRPLNISPYAPGSGSRVFELPNKKVIRVSNLLGWTYMNATDNYLIAFDNLLKIASPADIHIVDFHAETTSEKVLFAHCYDGVVTAVYGTHTHVMTADNRILPQKTAFLTDVGMTGPYHSVIGLEIEPIIQRVKYNAYNRFSPATGEGQLCAWYLQIDDQTNLVVEQSRVYITPDLPY